MENGSTTGAAANTSYARRAAGSLAARNALRKSHACTECKRRKVRCSGDERCKNCTRDDKVCKYSSPLQQLSTAQTRLQQAEQRIRTIEKAWAIHLPNVDLNDAIERLQSGEELPPSYENSTPMLVGSESDPTIATDEQQSETSPAEYSNAEDYEFNESQNFDNSTDGMGFLVADPSKVGYTGPQSGVAALKFLQSLHLHIPFDSHNPLSFDGPGDQDAPLASSADISRYMNDYFSIYHSAYPILHEGTFRARVSGALAKPRDGSWPILYNIVLAIGAFVGATRDTNSDVPFYRLARKQLSMDILERGSLSYVQAIMLMANYLQKRNKPNSCFVLIGIGWSMALAIGLHREFGLPSSNPFTMEIRRRVWWTLFAFVSSAQLTLGRPPASLVGVNVRLPANLDDQDLAVDMAESPTSKDGPTATSCLIHQAKLAKLANMVQVELLSNPIPNRDRAMNLERSIISWQKDLPAYFGEEVTLENWFEIPKRVLIWRSLHLRIVLNRPAIFKAITAKEQLATVDGPIKACLTAAEECVESICRYFESGANQPRGLAWYAVYWLISASFVQATCYAYDQIHALAPVWKGHLERAVNCLTTLGNAHRMALRARDIFKKLLDQGELLPFFGSTMAPIENDGSLAADAWQFGIPATVPSQYPSHGLTNPSISSRNDNSFQWYMHGSPDAELLDATGGIMLQQYPDIQAPTFDNEFWMPA